MTTPTDPADLVNEAPHCECCGELEPNCRCEVIPAESYDPQTDYRESFFWCSTHRRRA